MQGLVGCAACRSTYHNTCELELLARFYEDAAATGKSLLDTPGTTNDSADGPLPLSALLDIRSAGHAVKGPTLRMHMRDIWLGHVGACGSIAGNASLLLCALCYELATEIAGEAVASDV